MRDLAKPTTPAMTPAELLLRAALISAYHPNHVLDIGAQALDLAEAHARAGGDFDLVCWDGEPSLVRCASDLEHALPFLDETVYLLIHHAAHYEVAEAIELTLAAHAELIDCGMIGRTAVWDTHHQTHYGGLRLLRYTRQRRLTIWAE
jgi:hypothetical protein